ncbi:hypothetical protein SAMN05443287_102211 [Micromonospora phaseoli]|uniref:Uncharacterized protein n=1 Tax=Micromonospora phaseoli TaxID=1144548 RepID=A0A1H6UD28_9ACTN|nr:hypothetical protein [Micromonospora phaseoli]PZV98975.1 hypothetical protein CLV64_104212 [Micromonospora phaseoli]GIJ76273.1 hypothetical protein Xph01_07050 [Micromonospora phaseoli]SEI90288.1 hypothetical protein SAMN05443287_102211 [Micromonospora phaseoli]
MSSLLAQVVAQLKSAVDQLDNLAVRATRAASDVAEANARYTDVGSGSNHPALRAAVTHSRTGVDKAHRLARLNSEAARNVAAYLNAIAPGSVPQSASPSGPPSGEELMADSDRRNRSHTRVGGFLNRSLRKADDAQDLASSATEALQQGAKALRDMNGPSGTQSAGTATPSAPGPTPRPKIDGAEAAGNLVVVGLLVGVATHRATRLIRSWTARGRQK